MVHDNLLDSLFDDRRSFTEFFRVESNDTEKTRSMVLKTTRLKWMYCEWACPIKCNSVDVCRVFSGCSCSAGHPRKDGVPLVRVSSREGWHGRGAA